MKIVIPAQAGIQKNGLDTHPCPAVAGFRAYDERTLM
jgi:hypothetical protein